MVSFAAVHSPDLFADQGGPLANVATRNLRVGGRTLVQALAYLRPEIAQGRPDLAVFEDADGTAVAESERAACRRAVDAALERWAYLAVGGSRHGQRYGFDADPSDNGMAAHAGLLTGRARARARWRALERFAVVGWWDGRLPAEVQRCAYPDVQLVRIHHAAGAGEVVVLARNTRAGYVYSHASAATLSEASLRAAIGLARAETSLATYRAMGALANPANFRERRALFFSRDEGAELFWRRLREPTTKPAAEWRLHFDGEIPGPWSRWTTVWRCAAEMPTRDFLEPDANFFYW